MEENKLEASGIVKPSTLAWLAPMLHRYWPLLAIVLIFLLNVAIFNAATPRSLPTFTGVSNSMNDTAVINFIGLQPGSPITYRYSPNYVTTTQNVLGYDYPLVLNISGATTWQWQGTGTAVSYNGVTYVFNSILSSTALSGLEGTIYPGNTYNIYFQEFLNLTNFNQTQATELEAAGVSANSPIIIKLLQNINTTVPYNGTHKTGYSSSSATDDNGTITFTNTKVISNSSYICLNLTSSLFNQNVCNPGTYKLGVVAIGNRFGVDGTNSLQITATLSSSLKGNNKVPFNAIIKVGSNVLYSLSQSSQSSLQESNTFTYYPNEPLNISVESGGNINYTIEDPVTIPSNIVAYVPIVVNNLQASGIAANTAIPIGVSKYGNLIGIDAVTYQQYELPELNNTEFFFDNGTVDSCWLAGNALSPVTSNILDTNNVLGVNALSTSANVIYWCNVPGTAYLPSTSQNDLNLGFSGNFLTSENVLFSKTGSTGEAPQLSCSNPQNPAKCNGVYGGVDNGNVVFTHTNAAYWNFTGANVQGWTITLGTDGSDTVANSLGLTLSAPNWGTFAVSTNDVGVTGRTFVAVMNSTATGGADQYFVAGSTTTDGTPGGYGAIDWHGQTGCPNGYCFANAMYNNPAAPKGIGQSMPYDKIYHSFMFIITSAGTLGGGWEDYNSLVATNSIQTLSHSYPTFGTSGASSGAGSSTLMYAFVTNSPPANVFPNDTYGTVQLVGACYASISNPSNGIVEVGQYESFTASNTNCDPTFTYNIITVNSITTSITNSIKITGSSTSSVTANIYITTQDISNSLEEGNVILTDSGTNTVTSPYSSGYAIYQRLQGVTISPSNNPIDAGQYETYTGSWAGGNALFNGNFYNVTGTKILHSFSSLSTSPTTYTFQTSSASTGSFTYNVQLTDSATTPITNNSIGNVIIINPDLAPTISATNTVIDGSQYEVWTGYAGGGSSAFTYNFQIVNGLGSFVTNNLQTGIIGSSTTFTWQIPAWVGSNTLKANVIVTDIGATTPTTANSIQTSVTAYAQPTTQMTFNAGTSIIAGNDFAMNDIVSGGSGTFTFSNTINNVNFKGTLVGTTGVSNVMHNPSTGVYVYNEIVTDTGTTAAFQISQETNTITVTSGGISTIITLTTCTTPQVMPYTCTITGSVQPPANQFVSGTLWVNNNPVGVTGINSLGNSISYTFTNQAGSYSMVFNTLSTLGGYTYGANSLSTSFNGYGYLSVTNILTTLLQPEVFYPSTTHINPTSAANATWNVIFTGATTLQGNIQAYDIFIQPGVVINPNGFSLIAVNMIYFPAANIQTNGVIAGGAGGVGSANENGITGTSIATSYGGAGGVGVGSSCSAQGGNGGNTLALGGVNNGCTTSGNYNGLTPTMTVNNLLIQSIFPSLNTYLTGAGGGGGRADASANGGTGGSGSGGCYLQANTIYAGNVITAGINGINSATGGGGSETGGGGGGGGICILAYNSIYSPGTYNVLGGAPGKANGNPAAQGYGGNGNVIAYQYLTPPEGLVINSNILTTWNIPVKLIGANYPSYSPLPLTYNFFSIQLGTNALYSNANSFNYTIPVNSYTGDHAYETIEMSGGNIIYINQTFIPLNGVVQTAQASNGIYAVIQYLPAYISNTISFYYPPINYIIDGYTNTLYGTNIIKGTPTLNLPLNIQVNYNGFAPFNLTYQNGETTNSLPANAFLFYSNNVIPGNMFQRQLLTVNSFDAQYFQSVFGNSIGTFTASTNNYTFIGNVPQFNSNTFTVFVPQANFINPNIIISNLTISTTATNLIKTNNQYCQFTNQFNIATPLNPYLPNSLASTYSLTVYQTNGQPLTSGYVAVQTSSPALQVQSLKLAPGLQIALEPQQLYGFTIYNSNCKQIYQSAYTQWGSIINLNLSTANGTGYISQSAFLNNINASCNYLPKIPTNIIPNTIVTCKFNTYNGSILNTSLVIYKNGALASNQFCYINSPLISKNTLQCNGNYANNTGYFAIFQAQNPATKVWYTLVRIPFGINGGAFGANGVYIGIIMVIAIILLFIARQPIIAIILMNLLLIAEGYIGLLPYAGLVVGFGIVASGLVVYTINRGHGSVG